LYCTFNTFTQVITFLMLVVHSDNLKQMVLFTNHQHPLIMKLCIEQNIHQKRSNHVQLLFLNMLFFILLLSMYVKINVGHQEIIMYFIIRNQVVTNSISHNMKQSSLSNNNSNNNNLSQSSIKNQAIQIRLPI
jgi:uncharacterized membrane protein